MGILQARILEWVAIPSSGDLPDPGIKHRSPTLWVNSLPSEPPKKPYRGRVLTANKAIHPMARKNSEPELRSGDTSVFCAPASPSEVKALVKQVDSSV